MPQIFETSVDLPVSVETAFAWHTRPGAIFRMLPPFDHVEVLHTDNSIHNGARVVIKVPLVGPFRKTWVAEHFDYRENVHFCDRQVTGPFGSFEHQHLFTAISATQCRLTDHIEYRPPLGPLGALGKGIIRSKLQAGFAYRHRVLVSDLTRHAAWADRPRMKIAITGSSGLVGSTLIPFLTTGGHEVIRMLRRKSVTPSMDGTRSIQWNPDHNELNPADLEGIDAVIHLAGEGIAEGRWNAARKERILNSRVKSTGLLAQTLAKLQHPPRVFFSTSAIGYYAPSGDKPITEVDRTGEGFLPDVCRAWEGATRPAEQAGIRTVHGRVGVVLTPQGGALGKQLPLFQWGVAGRLCSGNQYVPWIEIGDLIGAIHQCVMNESLRGPVNLTAPEPVTNTEFTRTLGKVLRRPTFLPAPSWALRLALGEMADALLLASLRVIPQRLQDVQFAFDYPTLEPALRHLLGR